MVSMRLTPAMTIGSSGWTSYSMPWSKRLEAMAPTLFEGVPRRVPVCLQQVVQTLDVMNPDLRARMCERSAAAPRSAEVVTTRALRQAVVQDSASGLRR